MTIPCQLLADCSLRLAGLKGVPNSFSAFARNTLDPRCGSGWFSRSAAREDGLGWCRLHKTIDFVGEVMLKEPTARNEKPGSF
jgi:hypothetical protein